MSLPEFTAELSLRKSTRIYRARPSYGGPAQGNSAHPANVFPSQFDGSEEPGDLDATDIAMGAGEDDAELGENGDEGFEGLEDGEASDPAGEDEGDDETDLG